MFFNLNEKSANCHPEEPNSYPTINPTVILRNEGSVLLEGTSSEWILPSSEWRWDGSSHPAI